MSARAWERLMGTCLSSSTSNCYLVTTHTHIAYCSILEWTVVWLVYHPRSHPRRLLSRNVNKLKTDVVSIFGSTGSRFLHQHSKTDQAKFLRPGLMSKVHPGDPSSPAEVCVWGGITWQV